MREFILGYKSDDDNLTEFSSKSEADYYEAEDCCVIMSETFDDAEEKYYELFSTVVEWTPEIYIVDFSLRLN